MKDIVLLIILALHKKNDYHKYNTCFCTHYRTAGNFGVVFNLANWPNLIWRVCGKSVVTKKKKKKLADSPNLMIAYFSRYTVY